MLREYFYQTLLATVCVLWIGWRLYRFTIVPIMWPGEPRVLPYSVPFLGHTISFLRDPEGTLRYGHEYFCGGREPFAVYVGGRRMVIVRTSQDISDIWKDTKALSFDSFIQDMFRGIGVSQKSYSRMFLDHPASFVYETEKSDALFVKENPLDKRYIDLQEGWIKEQLQPGDRMEKVQALLLDYIDKLMTWETSPPACVLSENSEQKVIGLRNWTRHVLIDAGTKAFIGPEILKIDTDFLQHYMDWEDLSWKVVHQYPAFLARDMQKARAHLVKTFSEYYTLPPKERPQLSWLFDRMQSEQRKLGLTIDEAASISIIMLMGVHLNTNKILFWTLAHILSDPSLHATIVTEITPWCPMNGPVDTEQLAAHSPTLLAVWQESLRLYTAAAVIRSVNYETMIGGKRVSAGDHVMGPFRLLHLDRDNFGSDANVFDPARWLQGEKAVSKKAFYPFGGGRTYCPGRVIAKQEVCCFVALALTRFELQPLSERDPATGRYRLPRIDNAKPVLTALEPESDFLICARKK